MNTSRFQPILPLSPPLIHILRVIVFQHLPNVPTRTELALQSLAAELRGHSLEGKGELRHHHHLTLEVEVEIGEGNAATATAIAGGAGLEARRLEFCEDGFWLITPRGGGFPFYGVSCLKLLSCCFCVVFVLVAVSLVNPCFFLRFSTELKPVYILYTVHICACFSAF